MKRTTLNNIVGGIAFTAILLAVLSFFGQARASDHETGPLGPYDMTQVERVYDGDTFYGWAETFIYQTMYMKIRIRNIDTPEIRGSDACERKLAYAARDYLAHLLANAKTVSIDNLAYDNFGRVLASVQADNINVAVKMIESGHARPYVKGASGGWCLLG